MEDSILITGGTLVTASGDKAQDFLIEDGVVSDVVDPLPTDLHTIDATGLLIFPGFIDAHVHFRDPGFPNKGTMLSEAVSARAGGVTTVCDMPNTEPPTVTIAALADKVRRAQEISDCDMRFFFGVTQSAHLATLRELFQGTAEELVRLRKYCCGVKLYLDHSTGDQKVDGGIVDDVFNTCSELGIVLVAHCEDADMNAAALSANTQEDVAAHSQIRSAESEVKAIEFALDKAKKYGTHLHVAHLSTAQGLESITNAKQDDVRVTCEVAPHHLFLSVDDYVTLGTLGKMNPPLRSRGDCEALMQGLIDRTVDIVATDHAPHTLEEKQSGEPLQAPSGVPGVETMIPLLLTATSGRSPHPMGASISGLTHAIILDACFTKPNEIFSLGKSQVVPGMPADLTIIDPHAEWEVHATDLHAHCKWTPYENWKLTGKVVNVF